MFMSTRDVFQNYIETELFLKQRLQAIGHEMPITSCEQKVK